MLFTPLKHQEHPLVEGKGALSLSAGDDHLRGIPLRQDEAPGRVVDHQDFSGRCPRSYTGDGCIWVYMAKNTKLGVRQFLSS